MPLIFRHTPFHAAIIILIRHITPAGDIFDTIDADLFFLMNITMHCR